MVFLCSGGWNEGPVWLSVCYWVAFASSEWTYCALDFVFIWVFWFMFTVAWSVMCIIVLQSFLITVSRTILVIVFYCLGNMMAIRPMSPIAAKEHFHQWMQVYSSHSCLHLLLCFGVYTLNFSLLVTSLFMLFSFCLSFCQFLDLELLAFASSSFSAELSFRFSCISS